MRLSSGLLLLAFAGCASEISLPVCEGNDQCAAGQVCLEDGCTSLCNGDLQCPVGFICDGGTCLEGMRSGIAPEIFWVDGDGDVTCTDTPSKNCMASGVRVGGAGLAGATFYLDGPLLGAPRELSARTGVAPGEVHVLFPDVPPGDYTLSAVNGAGADETQLTLLQGVPGPQGPPGPAGSSGTGGSSATPNELVTTLNQASTQLSVDLLPVGLSPRTVAPGDHVHDATDLVSGTLAIDKLPVGLGATEVARGDHTHVTAMPTLTVEDVVSASAINGGYVTETLTPIASSFCALSSVAFQDIDSGTEQARCSVTVSGANWLLTAYSQAGDDADAWCSARCLSW